MVIAVLLIGCVVAFGFFSNIHYAGITFKELQVSRSTLKLVSMENVQGIKNNSRILRLDLANGETFYLDILRSKYARIFEVCEKHPEANISIWYPKEPSLSHNRHIFQMEIASQKIIIFKEMKGRSRGIAILTGLLLFTWIFVVIYVLKWARSGNGAPNDQNS